MIFKQNILLCALLIIIDKNALCQIYTGRNIYQSTANTGVNSNVPIGSIWSNMPKSAPGFTNGISSAFSVRNGNLFNNDYLSIPEVASISSVPTNYAYSITNNVPISSTNKLIYSRMPVSEIPFLNDMSVTGVQFNSMPLSGVPMTSAMSANALASGMSFNGLPMTSANGFQLASEISYNGLPITSTTPTNGYQLASGIPYSVLPMTSAMSANGLQLGSGMSYSGLPMSSSLINGIPMTSAMSANGLLSFPGMAYSGIPMTSAMPVNGLPMTSAMTANGLPMTSAMSANGLPITSTMSGNGLPMMSDMSGKGLPMTSTMSANGLPIMSAMSANGLQLPSGMSYTELPMTGMSMVPQTTADLPQQVLSNELMMNSMTADPKTTLNSLISMLTNRGSVAPGSGKPRMRNRRHRVRVVQAPLASNPWQMNYYANVANTPMFGKQNYAPISFVTRNALQEIPGNVKFNVPSSSVLQFGDFASLPIVNGMPVAGITETVTVLGPDVLSYK